QAGAEEEAHAREGGQDAGPDGEHHTGDKADGQRVAGGAAETGGGARRSQGGPQAQSGRDQQPGVGEAEKKAEAGMDTLSFGRQHGWAEQVQAAAGQDGGYQPKSGGGD